MLIAKKMTYGVITVLIVSAGLLLAVKLSAQEQAQPVGPGNGLRVSPTRSERTIAPGQTDEITVTVENITSSAITVVPFVNDFLPSEDESGTPLVAIDDNLENNPYSIKGFIDELAAIDLEPGQKEDVLVEIRIPDGTGPGAYFGAIRFSTNPNADSGNIGLTASVGTLVLISVPGDVLEQLTLEQMSAARNIGEGESKTGSIFETPPDLVVIRLNNQGNTFVQPFGKIYIKDWRGRIVHEFEFNSTDPRGNVLPNSIRRFDDAQQNAIKSVGRFGRYKIEANLSYGEGGGNLITVTESFWVVPYRIILAALAVLALVVWFLTRGIRIYNRRVVERAKRNS